MSTSSHYSQSQSQSQFQSKQSSSTSYLSRPSSGLATHTSSTSKSRQYAHLHAQLAQLNAHLADTENIVRMTADQAEQMRFLGGYVGAMFMSSARVLGEESVRGKENGRE